MGKYDAHYPEIAVTMPDGTRKTIRTRELKGFFKGLGLDREEIDAFCTAIDVRNGLVKMTNYLALFYTKLGVIEVEPR